MTVSTKELAQHRRESFKKTIDAKAGSFRRSQQTFKIRKEKRDENMMKRRQMVPSISLSASWSSDNELSKPGTPTQQDVTRWAMMLTDCLQTSNEVELVKLVKEMRRQTQREEKSTIVTQILSSDHEILSLIGLVLEKKANTNPYLAYECAWLLTNIVTDSSAGAHAVALAKIKRNSNYNNNVDDSSSNSNSLLDFFVKLLDHRHPIVRRQSAFCLSNIAGDDLSLRDMILQFEGGSVVNAIIKNFMNPDPTCFEMLDEFSWFASNLVRGRPKPPMEKVEPLIVPLSSMITRRNVPEDARMNCLWAFTYMTDGDEDVVQRIINTGIIPVLAGIISHEKEETKRFLLTAVKILGNIAGKNDRQTQAVVDTGILQHADRLINHRTKKVRKETAFLLSNIAAGTTKQISELVRSLNVLTSIVERAESDVWEVRKECVWVLSNLCSEGGPEIVRQVVISGGLQSLCSVLQMSNADTDILIVVLKTIDVVLKAGAESGTNYYIVRLEECKGVEAIEEIQMHANDTVYEKAVYLIETYFNEGVDADDENNGLAPKSDGDTFGFGLSSPPISKQLFPSSYNPNTHSHDDNNSHGNHISSRSSSTNHHANKFSFDTVGFGGGSTGGTTTMK